jgi:hypothetical protein
VVSAACEVVAGQKSGDSEGPGKALSVEFTRLKSPIKPKDHLADIEILSDPARNPLTRFGGAKEPVYFGELADSHAWFYEDLIERSGGVIGAERHLLIRLPESEDGVPSAIDQYRALMRDKGRVALVLDCRVSDKQLGLFSALLHAGKHISVYLLDATAKEALFESRLVGFARYPDSVSSDYIPPIHEPAVQDGNVCLTIDSIDEINLIDQLDELIVFENATNSRVTENLKGRKIMNEVLKVAITGSGQKTGDVATDDDVRELANELSWKPDDLRELFNGITNRRGQVIFSGPPGTGKTYCAERIARFLLAGIEPEEEIEKRVHIVQFHPTYSYQEFVEGLQPEVEDAGFRFAWRDGVLKKICASIESSRSAGTSARHVLIIDEINRANVPSVLGEMMYLLEYRDKNVKLSSGTTFTLPEDLIIIGTMNSADRSIRGLDLALRRRFDFFDLVPEGMAIRKFYSSGGRGKLTGMTVDELVSGFDGLNEEIRKDCQTADLMIGHSYFMEEEMNPRVLSRIWRQQLKPLIREYFLGTIELTSKYETEKSFWKL